MPFLPPPPLPDFLAPHLPFQRSAYQLETGPDSGRRIHFIRGEAWIRSFTGPMAFVWGMNDPILGPALRRHERTFPHVPATRTQAGHFLQEEVPEELASAVRDVSRRAAAG